MRREIRDVRPINPFQSNSLAKQELLGFLGSLKRFAYLIHQSTTGLFLGALVLGSAGGDDQRCCPGGGREGGMAFSPSLP